MALTIAVLSQKGGTGKTTTVRHLTDVLPPRGPAASSPSTSTRRATCRTTSTSSPEAEPTIGDVLAGRAKAARRDPRRHHPGEPSLAEAELSLAGKMGRELTLRKRAARTSTSELRRRPHRLPAGARAADGQRARRRRPRAASAEAQYFALQGVEQALEVIELARDSLNPDLEWLGVRAQHRRHAHVHSREAFDVAEGARRRQAARARRSASRSPTPSRPSAASRSSTTAPTSAQDYLRWPTSCCGARPAERARASCARRSPRPRRRPPSSSRTSAPCGSNGARRTSAQPPASRRSASTTPRGLRRMWHHTSTVGPAPEIVAPSAPRSRRRVDELHRARVEVRAAGLVQAVAQAAGDEVEVAAAEAEHQQRRVGGVEDGVGQRHLGGQRRRAPRGCARARAGTTRTASSPAGASKRVDLARRRRRRSRRAARRRRCRDGPRARWPAPSRSASSSNRWSAASRPATYAAALVPSPPLSGISERMRKVKSVGGRSARSRGRRGCARSRRSPGRSRPRTCPSRRPRAPGAAPARRRTRRSPGPRLAEEAGTRTRRRRCTADPSARAPRRSTAASSGVAGHDGAGLVERGLRVLQAVAGEHADDALRAPGARAAAARRPRRRWPARRRRPRARRASGRRRGSRRR